MSRVGPIRAQEKVAILGFPRGLLSVPSAHQQEPGVRGWDGSDKHNCSLSGTKEMRSRAALAWPLGTQEQVGSEVIGCERQALGSGWSPCLPARRGYCECRKRGGRATWYIRPCLLFRSGSLPSVQGRVMFLLHVFTDVRAGHPQP